MVVTKILEGTLAAGATTLTFTDSDIPNSLIRIYNTDVDVYPSAVTVSENNLIITYPAQNSPLYIAVGIEKEGLEIIDALDSTATNKALSAKQGKELKTLIDNVVQVSVIDNLESESTTAALSANQGRILKGLIDNLDAADISYDNTVSGMTADDVQEALDEVFQSVSDGKSLIAGAITDKGVPTSATDSFSTMATNIAAISGGGDSPVLEHIYGSMSSFDKSYTMTKAGTVIIYGLVLGTNNVVTYKNGSTVTQTYAYATSSPATRMRYWEISVAINDVIRVTASSISAAKTLVMII